MSIRNIQILSLNSHFIAKIIQCFLTGYGKPCEIRIIFFVAPIIFYKSSRNKLIHANSKSKMETIFEGKIPIENDMQVSSKVHLAGFWERYEQFKDYTKKSIIILSNEDKIIFDNFIELIEQLDYKSFDGEIKQWMRSAYYLGKIFSQATEIQINYYLGVEV